MKCWSSLTDERTAYIYLPLNELNWTIPSNIVSKYTSFAHHTKKRMKWTSHVICFKMWNYGISLMFVEKEGWRSPFYWHTLAIQYNKLMRCGRFSRLFLFRSNVFQNHIDYEGKFMNYLLVSVHLFVLCLEAVQTQHKE